MRFFFEIYIFKSNETYSLCFAFVGSLILMVDSTEVGHWRWKKSKQKLRKQIIVSAQFLVKFILPITGTGNAITSTPLREQTPPTILPAIVSGTMSP